MRYILNKWRDQWKNIEIYDLKVKLLQAQAGRNNVKNRKLTLSKAFHKWQTSTTVHSVVNDAEEKLRKEIEERIKEDMDRKEKERKERNDKIKKEKENKMKKDKEEKLKKEMWIKEQFEKRKNAMYGYYPKLKKSINSNTKVVKGKSDLHKSKEEEKDKSIDIQHDNDKSNEQEQLPQNEENENINDTTNNNNVNDNTSSNNNE
jgi:hypothetical protein